MGEGGASMAADGEYRSDVLADVTEMVHRALASYGEWAAPIAPNARLGPIWECRASSFNSCRATWSNAGARAPSSPRSSGDSI